MKKLVYIDSCIRKEESSTLKIASPIVDALKEYYDVIRIDLNTLDLDVINYEKYHERMGGYIKEDILEYAKQIATADRIVVAAPFWDMSFPSRLKVFLEQCSLFNVTFGDDGVSSCYGLCKAEKMLFITSRGGDYPTGSEFEQATPYLKALGHLWGINHLDVIDVYNMDYSSEEVKQNKIKEAINKGLELVKNF